MNLKTDAIASSPTETQRPGVSVSISAYNEAATLEGVLHELIDALKAANIPYEICIVDDGSTDGTAELSDRLAANEPTVKVIHHPVNMGIGPTVRDGNNSGTMPFMTGLPGDGQFPASIIPEFWSLIQDADMVLGYVPDLEKGRPPLLTFFSWAERLLVRILFGPIPQCQGVIMTRRSWLDRNPLTTQGRGWIIQMEVIVRAVRSGARIVTAPTSIRPREHGKSRATTLRNICSNLWQMICLWHRLRSEKRQGMAVDTRMNQD